MDERSKRKIENTAVSLLKDKHSYNPAFNIKQLLIDLNIDLVETKLEPEIAGFSCLEKGKKVIFANTNVLTNKRTRFTIAHELGHILLHGFNEFNLNRRGQTYFRNTKSTLGSDIQEIEANFFAACLLMPKELLENEISKLGPFKDVSEEDITALSEIFDVSISAMTIRLSSLGYI